MYLFMHLVETFALILYSKVVYKNLVWLTLSVLKSYTTYNELFNTWW